MNCFDFQNRTSDYLDELLSADETAEFNKHLQGCQDCEARSRHYRQILETLTTLPKSLPPAVLGRVPRHFSLRPSRLQKTGKTLWRTVPWYLRTTIEGISVVLLVLAAVSTGPKLRRLYEQSIERSMTEFNETFNDPLLGSPSELPPLVRGTSAAVPTDTGPAEDDFADEAELASEEVAEVPAPAPASASISGPDVRVGSSEIWRFNLKTDSPHDIRPRVVQILSELKVAADTPGLGGVEAPGGIQFDLLIAQSSVSALMRQLQKIAPRAPTNSPVGETFAWYKNKSKRSIPSGKTRVVIWLSQM